MTPNFPDSPTQVRFRNRSAPVTPSKATATAAIPAAPTTPVKLAFGQRSPRSVRRIQAPWGDLDGLGHGPVQHASGSRLFKVDAAIPAAEYEEFIRFATWACDAADSSEAVANPCISFANPINLRTHAAGYFAWSASRAMQLITHSLAMARDYASASSYLKSAQVAGAIEAASWAATLSVVPSACVHFVAMLSERLSHREAVWRARATALQNLEGALRRMENPRNARVEDARAHAAFMAACRKLPEVSAAAGMDATRNTASAIRDCLALPIHVGLAVVGRVAKSLDWPATASGCLRVATGVVNAIQGVCDLPQGLKAELPRAQALIDEAHARQNAIARHEMLRGPARRVPLQAVANAFAAHQARIASQQSRELAGGWLRTAKGMFYLTASAVTCYAGLFELMRPGDKSSPGVGSRMGSAMAALLTIERIAMGVKLIVRANALDDMTLRQQLMQVLIASLADDDLLKLALDSSEHTVRVPGGAFTDNGFAASEYKTRPADNEYIGMYLMARMIEDMLSGTPLSPVRHMPELQWLRNVAQMRETDLQNMLLIAQAKAPARRLDYLMHCLAPVFGTQLKLDDDGLQAPLPAAVVVDIAITLCRASRITTADVASAAQADNAYLTLACNLHRRITPEHFIDSVRRVTAHRRDQQQATTTHADNLALIEKLAEAAARLRQDALDSIASMSKADKRALSNAMPAIDEDALAEFTTLAAQYALADPGDRRTQLDILKKISACRAAQHLIAGPRWHQHLECGHALDTLLYQLDRRVATNYGYDSDDSDVVSTADSDSTASNAGTGINADDDDGDIAHRTDDAGHETNDVSHGHGRDGAIGARNDIAIDMSRTTNERRQRLARVETRRRVQDQVERERGRRIRMATMQDGGNLNQQS